MFRNSLRAIALLIFASLAAYGVFVSAHASSGYGVDEIVSAER
jgi:hypothetical protein